MTATVRAPAVPGGIGLSKVVLDVYKSGCWSGLKRAAGVAMPAAGPHEEKLGDGIERVGGDVLVVDVGRKELPCLLHAKMLLFWSKGRTAELWVGSHNWTKRAILGLNVEASLIVRLTDSSPLFAAAAEYLARMKGIAEPLYVAKVDFYKALPVPMDATDSR